MNRLKIAFLKSYDLKTQKTIFSNCSKCDFFFKRIILKANQRFKKSIYNFSKRLTTFLKIIFLNHTF
jgi:hypothetical protein